MYAHFFAHLSELTGYNVSMETIDEVYDSTYREVVHLLSRDKWLLDYVLNRETGELITYFDLILELKRIQRLEQFNSDEKSKLKTGVLMGHIVQQFEKVVNQKVVPKLTLYSSVRLFLRKISQF
jgi:uncharacterized Fe-S cluster-containing protein